MSSTCSSTTNAVSSTLILSAFSLHKSLPPQIISAREVQPCIKQHPTIPVNDANHYFPDLLESTKVVYPKTEKKLRIFPEINKRIKENLITNRDKGKQDNPTVSSLHLCLICMIDLTPMKTTQLIHSILRSSSKTLEFLSWARNTLLLRIPLPPTGHMHSQLNPTISILLVYKTVESWVGPR
jgi:hypothetical protein